VAKKNSRSVSNFVFRATQASSASLIPEFRLGFFSSTTIHQPEIHMFRRDLTVSPSTIHQPSFLLNQTRNKRRSGGFNTPKVRGIPSWTIKWLVT
jgi:hypothetical protein